MKIGNRNIGKGHPSYLIAEIGLNHNGSLELAEQLIAESAKCGFDCVKFQKRTVEEVYTQDVLNRPREGPFGDTYGEEKFGLEFEKHEYDRIDDICKAHRIDWSASCWDKKSVGFIAGYGVPFLKVPSPCVHNVELMDAYAATGLPIIASTGLCDENDIDNIVAQFKRDRLALMHCISAYPAPTDQLNISAIKTLAKRYGVPVGYSGHEVGVSVTPLAIAYGAFAIERHVTMDRTMYGSDHAASIEPVGMESLVRKVRAAEQAIGDGTLRIMECEDKGKRLNLKG